MNQLLCVKGFIEIVAQTATRVERDSVRDVNMYEAVLNIAPFVGRDTLMWGVLFGCIGNFLKFPPVVGERGLPDDVSETVALLHAADSVQHTSWITFDELNNINWRVQPRRKVDSQQIISSQCTEDGYPLWELHSRRHVLERSEGWRMLYYYYLDTIGNDFGAEHMRIVTWVGQNQWATKDDYVRHNIMLPEKS